MRHEIPDSGVISRKFDGKFNYNAWPSVITLPDGTLLCAWSGDRVQHICPFGKVLAARSTDGGKTWTPPYKILDTPLDDRDAGLTAANGKVYLTSFTNSREMQKYYAELYNFPPAEKAANYGYLERVSDEDELRFLGATLAVSNDNGYTFSTPEVLPVTTPHGLLKTKSGRLLMIGRAFDDRAKTAFPKLPEGIYSMEIGADGKTFGAPRLIAESPAGMLYCEPHAALLPDGTIVLGIRLQGDNGLFTIHQCFSFDDGETFTEPRPTGFDGSPPHYLVHSSGALVLTYARRNTPQAEIARISLDGGKTYGDEIILSDLSSDWDLGYPCTAEAPDSSLVTVYYEKHAPGEKNAIRFTRWKIAD